MLVRRPAAATVAGRSDACHGDRYAERARRAAIATRNVSRSSLPRHGRSSGACRRTWRRRRVLCGMTTTLGFRVPPTVRDRARRLSTYKLLDACALCSLCGWLSVFQQRGLCELSTHSARLASMMAARRVRQRHAAMKSLAVLWLAAVAHGADGPGSARSAKRGKQKQPSRNERKKLKVRDGGRGAPD